MRETFAMVAATPLIGTACLGPNATTRIGTRMIEDPVPTMPLTVPANSPAAHTSRRSIAPPHYCEAPRSPDERVARYPRLSRISLPRSTLREDGPLMRATTLRVGR